MYASQKLEICPGNRFTLAADQEVRRKPKLSWMHKSHTGCLQLLRASETWSLSSRNAFRNRVYTRKISFEAAGCT